MRSEDEHDGDGIGQPAPQVQHEVIQVRLRDCEAAVGDLVNCHIGAHDQHADQSDHQQQDVGPNRARLGTHPPGDHVDHVLARHLTEQREIVIRLQQVIKLVVSRFQIEQKPSFKAGDQSAVLSRQNQAVFRQLVVFLEGLAFNREDAHDPLAQFAVLRVFRRIAHRRPQRRAVFDG